MSNTEAAPALEVFVKYLHHQREFRDVSNFNRPLGYRLLMDHALVHEQ